MTAKDIYSIGAKLLGVFLLALGLVHLPNMVIAFYAAANSNLDNPAAYSLGALVQSVIYFLVGMFLYLRHKIPTSTTHTQLPIGNPFQLGTRLLGLYFLVSGFAGSVGAISEALLMHSTWSFHFGEIAQPLLMALIGVILVFRPTIVDTWLLSVMPERPTSHSSRDRPNRAAP